MAKKTKKPKLVEMTVIVYVDGKEVAQTTNKEVPAFAADYVTHAALVQVEDPDIEAAEEAKEWPDAESAVRGR